MARTLDQLIVDIQTWLAVDQEDSAERLPDAVCGQLVNWAIVEYCRGRESKYGEKSDTFATVAEQRDYTEPTRFSKPGKIYYFNPDTGEVTWLSFLDKSAFDLKFPGSVNYATGGPYAIAGLDTTLILGDPSHYSTWAGNYILGPVPDRIITVFRDYWEIPADLVVSPGTNTNRMVDVADQFVLFKALSGASAFGVEDSRIPMWTQLARDLEGKLDSEDSRRWMTGKVSQSQEPG